MINLSKTSLTATIISKLENVVDVHRKMDTIQKRDDLVKLVITDETVPSLDAARTVAIKDSNQVDKIRDEHSKPSFSSNEEDVFSDKIMPSKFTKNFNVTDIFVDTSTVIGDLNMSDNREMQILKLSNGSFLISRIVIPYRVV